MNALLDVISPPYDHISDRFHVRSHDASAQGESTILDMGAAWTCEFGCLRDLVHRGIVHSRRAEAPSKKELRKSSKIRSGVDEPERLFVFMKELSGLA